MKKTLTIIGIILLIAGYYLLNAWSDYTWESRYLSSMGSNWILYKKFANVVDPIHFYSIIKTPTTRIGMFDKTLTKEISNGVYYVRLLWADKELGGGVTEQDFRYLMDCNKKQGGWKKGKDGSESVDPSEIYSTEIIWSSFYENEKNDPIASKLYEEECDFLNKGIY